MRYVGQLVLCSIFALITGIGTARASDAFRTISGVSGYGIAGVGGEGPGHQYYVQLDSPLQAGGREWGMLVTSHELPVAQHVTLCARVEVRHFEGIESRYDYALITDIARFSACE
jgi:hypothetical protein